MMLVLPLEVFAKDYMVKIRNTLGEPQRGMILKVMGKEYISDSRGVIEFTYSGKTKPNINLFFPDNPGNPVRRLTLDELEENPVLRLDSKADLARYKQEGVSFPIEGIVRDEKKKVITGAVVSILGTDRKTVTDEIGLFQIDADFGHRIIVRAQGKENKTLSLEDFLKNPEEPLNIGMRAKALSKLYTTAEKMPEFKGGMGAFWTYMEKNLEYPEKAKAQGKEGVVVVQFVVEKSGEITEATVMRKARQDMDEAALAFVENMPEWKPASENGKPVRCKYTVPVKFSLPKPKPDPVKPLDTEGPLLDPMRTLALDSIDVGNILIDSIAADSLMTRADSIAAEGRRLIGDSLTVDSIARDSLILDSLAIDTTIVKNDSLALTPPDSIADNPKALKKWLKEQKKAEKKRLKLLKKEEKKRLKEEKKRLKEEKKRRKAEMKAQKARLKEEEQQAEAGEEENSKL